MKRLRLVVFIFVISFSAFAGSNLLNPTPIIKNLVNSLNYNKYDQFVRDGSLNWRKSMNRAKYNKLRKQMLGYIGHIVGWKFVAHRTKDKIRFITYKLTGDNEAIGLLMLVQVYQHEKKLVVNNVEFLQR